VDEVRLEPTWLRSTKFKICSHIVSGSVSENISRAKRNSSKRYQILHRYSLCISWSLLRSQSEFGSVG
jgi:hypothetical protein